MDNLQKEDSFVWAIAVRFKMTLKYWYEEKHEDQIGLGLGLVTLYLW